MKLLGIYCGNIKTMSNTPCKIAVFTDGRAIKVFQKEFFRNNLNHSNWTRNVILEKHNIKSINNKLVSSGFSRVS